MRFLAFDEYGCYRVGIVMNKSQLAVACLGIALAPPPLILAAMNADTIFVEDLQSGSLLFFTENH